MPTINVQVEGLDHFIAKFGGFKTVYDQTARNFFTRATFAIQGQAQARTPVKTGNLRRSMATQVDPSPFPVWAKVGSAQPYAHFIEEGWRHDPRVRVNGGRVFRRRGAARMLATAVEVTRGTIQGYLRDAVQEIADYLRR